jgi:hypothetical protein
MRSRDFTWFDSQVLDFFMLYPVEIPAHSPLSEKIIRAASSMPLSQVLPGRELRPGSEDFPFSELLSRMPDGFGRVSLKHEMARARFRRTALESYRVFRHFRPSVILNYNLDGLATHHCGDIHEVFDPHGTVEVGYGSPMGAALMSSVREHDFTPPADPCPYLKYGPTADCAGIFTNQCLPYRTLSRSSDTASVARRQATMI